MKILPIVVTVTKVSVHGVGLSMTHFKISQLRLCAVASLRRLNMSTVTLAVLIATWVNVALTVAPACGHGQLMTHSSTLHKMQHAAALPTPSKRLSMQESAIKLTKASVAITAKSVTCLGSPTIPA